MIMPLSDDALRRLFLDARTHHAWTDEPVDDATLRRLWDLARMGPTSVNCLPARIVFVRTPEAKQRLLPALSPGNRAQTLAAPVTAVIGHDLDFPALLPRLWPHQPEAADWFADPVARETAALRNGTLQGAYLMLAARSLGLDCGPMSGFDPAQVDATFFAGTRVRSNFLCNLGHGDPAGLHPRGPRLDFDEACRVL